VTGTQRAADGVSAANLVQSEVPFCATSLSVPSRCVRGVRSLGLQGGATSAQKWSA
jgi:hypothetical protein